MTVNMDGNSPDAGALIWMPKIANQAVLRSLILSAIVCRGSLESGAGNPEAEAVHQRLREWLTALDLWGAAEPAEAAMLQAPLGGLEASVTLQSGWYAEGLAVLGWALNLLDFPKHDEQVDSYAVADAFWVLDEAAAELLMTGRLRSQDDLDACREMLYAIHVRLRQYARNGAPDNFASWIETSWLDALGCTLGGLTAQDDLAIDGKPLNQVTEERLQETLSITSERHRAIIWLMGEQPNYAEITVDT